MGGFPRFCKISSFCLKFHIFRKNHVFWWNFAFSAPKSVFPPLGPQKTSQNVTFIKGFGRVAPRSRFWAKWAVLGPKTLKRGGFHPFGPKRGGCSQKGEVALKKVKYFLRNTWCFDMLKIMIFMKIPWFSLKFLNFAKSCAKLFYFCDDFHIFSPARPVGADAYKTNAISYILKGPGRQWALFPENSLFWWNFAKRGENWKMCDFAFFYGKWLFGEKSSERKNTNNS